MAVAVKHCADTPPNNEPRKNKDMNPRPYLLYYLCCHMQLLYPAGVLLMLANTETEKGSQMFKQGSIQYINKYKKY